MPKGGAKRVLFRENTDFTLQNIFLATRWPFYLLTRNILPHLLLKTTKLQKRMKCTLTFCGIGPKLGSCATGIILKTLTNLNLCAILESSEGPDFYAGIVFY